MTREGHGQLPLLRRAGSRHLPTIRLHPSYGNHKNKRTLRPFGRQQGEEMSRLLLTTSTFLLALRLAAAQTGSGTPGAGTSTGTTQTSPPTTTTPSQTTSTATPN